MKNIESRLFRRRIIDPILGCWLWSGSLSEKGYGRINVNGINEKVHIIAAILWLDGYIRGASQICHKCNIKKCFNPNHLYIGNNSENQKDRYRIERRKKYLEEISFDPRTSSTEILLDKI